MQNAERKFHKKKRMGATHHLIYSITTSFGFDLWVTWGFEGTELFKSSNGFKIIGYQFRFLNGSKKMRNLIKITLKWLLFSEISEKLPSS